MVGDRRLRYRYKILWIQDREELIGTWLKELLPDESHHDTRTVLATFKAFQEVVESTMDIIAMYLRDHDIPSRDDYSNIDRIDLFSEGQKKLLREMNGMKTRIVHRYNGTDESLALSYISLSMPAIHSLVQVIEQWIMQQK
jgi:uncharacterized protein YutE (UPF0331/DUF86 family)